MTPYQIEADGREPATVHVYLPHGYEALAEPAALLVLFDARFWVANGVADMFDNLIAGGAVRPMVVLAVESIHGATRQSGLTHPDIFEPFLIDDLLPWAATRWKTTTDPADTVVAGQSLGGLTAAYVARSHPDRFGWVIGQSTSAWWPGDNAGGLTGRQVVDVYAAGEHVPVRFFLEVGCREAELLQSVRDMRDVLLELRYDVRYREYEGAHDVACWRGGLADGLITALGTRSA
jgi:enterochelin esterase family protein